MKIIKINFINCIRLWLVALEALIVALLLGFFLTHSREEFVGVMLYVSILLGVWLLPAIVLFVDYLLVDYNKRINVYSEGKFLISKKKTKRRVEISEISKIVIVDRNFPTEYGIKAMSWHSFFYYEVHLKNQEVLFVTCLMTRQLDKDIGYKGALEIRNAIFPFCST